MVIGGRCGGYWCVVVVVVAAIISKDLNQLHFEVVVVHSQDEERDEVVVVFCVNTGRLLGTFEGSRESLLGGGASLLFLMPFCHFLHLGGVVSQTQSGIMEVRKVVDDGLLLLGAIQDLRRRFCQNILYLAFLFCSSTLVGLQGSLLSCPILSFACHLRDD